MYHGFEWYGRVLEVREDRYAGLHGSRGRGGPSRGMGMGGRGFRGSRGGGYERGGRFGGGGRDWQAGNLYKDYTGPDGRGGNSGDVGGGYGAQAYGRAPVNLEPSQQIMVRNVSDF